ncbi:stimulator of interferon genes protein-like [Ptychodera flava]|uniref:stimulator of interferon genes protein-like n=1 Tax=Ptychodera flava TaxID=63121 RepID=UPI003969E14A
MAATKFTIENEVASAERESTRNKAEDVAIVEETVRDRKAITFFCHNNDKGWVEETTYKLGEQFVCQHGDADFIGGVSIPDNILRLIRECDTIVLVLSPDFLNSQLCKYEAQLTLSEHLFREQKIVIPVLLRGEDIPDFISHLTHLDVGDIGFLEKFMEH